MARTEVTKSITAYIKEHSLQNAENKRKLQELQDEWRDREAEAPP